MQNQKLFVRLSFGVVGLFLLYHIWVDQAWLNRLTSPSTTGAGWRAAQTHSVKVTDWTTPFCKRWSASDANNRSLQPFDLWHMHHPDWIVTSENEDEFCVSNEPSRFNPAIIHNMMLFYDNQFHSSCKRIHARSQWGSGWSADFGNINLGLIHALHHRVPCIITEWQPDDAMIGRELTHPWNYAANKKDYGQANQSSLVCEAGDTTCYFLPYQGCGLIDVVKNDSSVKLLQCTGEKHNGSHIWDDVGWSAYSFVTRKQQWLRRAVFDYKEKFKQTSNIQPGSDCTVMHVRRGDVIRERRPYYPVAFYVDMIPKEKMNDPNHYVFLLTDDSGAINEAHEFFPNIKWTYFNRPRHNGSSSGWEDHTPSGDPALEVVVIMAAFDLAQDCSTLVGGRSGFTDYIYEYMRRSQRHPGLKRYKIYKRRSSARMHQVPLNESEAELKKILDEMRKKKTKSPKRYLVTIDTS